MDCDTSMSGLSTPIKKIRNLSLSSPKPPSPVRYPSMSDFPIKSDFTISPKLANSNYGHSNFSSFNDYVHVDEINSDPIFQNMVDKGYSRTISNKVLQELDSRANEISSRMVPTPLMATMAAQKKKKRYSGIHRPLFSKMDSISSHYAASRSHGDSSPAKDFLSSATKKRRTLNGPEEIFGSEKENESPSRKVAGRPDSLQPSTQRLSPQRSHSPQLTHSLQHSHSPQPSQIPVFGQNIRLHQATPVLGTAPSLAAPTRANPANLLLSSPIRQDNSPTRIPLPSLTLVSPSKFNKISPSKGSMNLNLLLQGDDNFVKPAPKIRQSSLQMAGVYQNDGSTLQKKPSIASLQKKPSIPSLQKKLSIPSLQKKPSSSTLQKKPSIPTFGSGIGSTYTGTLTSSTVMDASPSIPSLQKKPSVPSFGKTPLTKKPSSQSLRTLNKKSSTSTLNKVTVPQPFSLYDRPTISSSQKSLSSCTSSTSHRSLNTLQNLASQRSLNRFQKFKSRFS